MTSKDSLPQLADIAPLPWEASIHNTIVDANGRTIAEVFDYWIRTEQDTPVFNDDATRRIAWTMIDAVNDYPALVAAAESTLSRIETLLSHPDPESILDDFLTGAAEYLRAALAHRQDEQQ